MEEIKVQWNGGVGSFSIPALKKTTKEKFEKEYSFLPDEVREQIWDKRNEYISNESKAKSKDVKS